MDFNQPRTESAALPLGTVPTIPTPRPRLLKRLLWFILCSLLLIFCVCWYAVSFVPAPASFPVNRPIEIVPGMSVKAIARTLAEGGYIQSELLLYGILLSNYEPSDLKASTYVFAEPLDVFAIAERLTEGDFTSSLIPFTHIEGERATTIAATAEATLQNFDSEEFLRLAVPLEGTLFPDTYLVPRDFSAVDLIDTMVTAYEATIAPLRGQIASSSLTEAEVVILASIIEREANSPESMKMVSGILQNRLRDNMPLQVDASVEYILDKPLAELTPEDLQSDTPYNTYLNRGLPPTAIGNPGLTAIMAVIDPTPSPYFFYITDTDGTFHYAETFDEHRLNIARYLR